MYLRINHPAESVGRDGKLLNTLRVRSRSEDARDGRNPAQRAKKTSDSAIGARDRSKNQKNSIWRKMNRIVHGLPNIIKRRKNDQKHGKHGRNIVVQARNRAVTIWQLCAGLAQGYYVTVAR